MFEKKWTREKIEKAYAEHVARTGDIPHRQQLDYEILPHPTSFKYHMGMTYTEYAQKYYPEYLKLRPCKRWTKEKIDEAYKAYTEKYGKAYTEKDGRRPDMQIIKDGILPSYSTFRKITGMTYLQYAVRYYPHLENDVYKTAWTREMIEEAYAAYIKENGTCPIVNELSRKVLPKTTTFKHVMGMGYADYAKKYYPEFYPHKWPKKKIEKAYSDFVRQNGRHPTYKEGDGKILPSPATLKRVMGMTYEEYAKTHPIDKDNPALDK